MDREIRAALSMRWYCSTATECSNQRVTPHQSASPNVYIYIYIYIHIHIHGERRILSIIGVGCVYTASFSSCPPSRVTSVWSHCWTCEIISLTVESSIITLKWATNFSAVLCSYVKERYWAMTKLQFVNKCWIAFKRQWMFSGNTIAFTWMHCFVCTIITVCYGLVGSDWSVSAV